MNAWYTVLLTALVTFEIAKFPSIDDIYIVFKPQIGSTYYCTEFLVHAVKCETSLYANYNHYDYNHYGVMRLREPRKTLFVLSGLVAIVSCLYYLHVQCTSMFKHDFVRLVRTRNC